MSALALDQVEAGTWLYVETAVAVVIVARASWLLLRGQVAFIYLHASVGKFKVLEWVDGTALYYWLLDPSIGAPDWLARWALPVLSSPLVAPLTWSVLILEFWLALGLVLSRGARRALLPFGLLFHTGIIFFHGLISFVLIMFGALVLLMRPYDEAFSFAWLRSRLPRRKPRSARAEEEEVQQSGQGERDGDGAQAA